MKSCVTPISAGMKIQTRSATLDAYRKVRMEQLLCDHNADCLAPCQETCPAGIDIQRYLALVSDGNFEAAIRVIKDANPFPSVCGRVCPHPCEAACRRNLVDFPVAINSVKRFAADHDLASGPWIPEAGASTGKRIAIVGAGPSGLSAAFYLALAGHAVTVFERQPRAGGMMRYGIPEYRLPMHTLDAEIGIIEAMRRPDHDRQVAGHPPAPGGPARRLRRGVPGHRVVAGHTDADRRRELPRVWLGINYLEKVTKGDDPELGDDVVVIGGGNTAIDCVRTAVRKGARSVKLVAIGARGPRSSPSRTRSPRRSTRASR